MIAILDPLWLATNAARPTVVVGKPMPRSANASRVSDARPLDPGFSVRSRLVARKPEQDC
jgi:hypothetical protein